MDRGRGGRAGGPPAGGGGLRRARRPAGPAGRALARPGRDRALAGGVALGAGPRRPATEVAEELLRARGHLLAAVERVRGAAELRRRMREEGPGRGDGPEGGG